MHSYSSNNRKYGVYQIVTIIAIALIIGFLFEKLLIDQYVQDQHIKATDQLSEIKSKVEQAVNLNLNLIEGLTAYISANPNISQQQFSRLGEEILRKNNALRNIAAAPDLVIRLMHPVKGNEKAIGLDYNKNEKQRSAALKAVEVNSTIIAGPLQLVQGGNAFISRTPVHINTETGDKKFWGLISTVLDVEKFYHLAGLNNENIELEIGIRGKDSTGKSGAVFYGEASLFEKDIVSTNINLPHGNWYMAGMPKSGWNTDYPNQAVFRFAYLIVVLIVTYLLWLNKMNTSRRLHAEMLAQQANLQKEMALESSEMKSHFLANISHELRTPMHAILSFSNLGLKRVEDEKIKDYLQRIHASGIRLTGLLDDLLDLSKLEAAKLEPDLKKNDLTETVLEAIEEIGSLAKEKAITVDVKTDKPLIGYFDKSLITRVIINTLSNAIKFSEQQSIIIIRLYKKPDNAPDILGFAIQDEGVGIPKDELETVFNSFAQSSKTRANKGGTGLGLPISKEIIHLHHGKFWAESPPAGKNAGSEFIFEIPVDYENRSINSVTGGR